MTTPKAGQSSLGVFAVDPDLAVTFTPPVSVQVNQPAGYNVRVKNVGHKSATGVKRQHVSGLLHLN